MPQSAEASTPNSLPASRADIWGWAVYAMRGSTQKLPLRPLARNGP